MNNYRNYSIEDLLLDDSFVHYCLETEQAATEQWSAWLLQNPDQESKLKTARKLLFSLGIRISAEEKTVEFNKLKTAVEALRSAEGSTLVNYQDPSLPPAAKTVETAKTFSLFRIAATIAAACLLVLLGYWLNNTKTPADQAGSPLAYEILSTGNGERKSVELVDGSTILLNSNSTIRIPLDYNRNKRDLQLQGEALFEVAKNAGKPFLVKTAETEVEALGTIFKVRSYSFENFVQTSLLEGKVSVTHSSRPSSSRILSPGMQSTFRAGADTAILTSFDIVSEEQWRQGELVFEHASIDQIQQTLQYWFGMEVELQGKPAKPILFNGKFNNKSLDDVMKAIAYVNNLSYIINDKQITIISK